MPSRCVVGGCSNTTYDGVTLHTFPKNEYTSKKWIAFVKRTRDKWNKTWQQAVNSKVVICSEHFTEDCYDPHEIRKKIEGFKPCLKVLPGSFPTIEPRMKVSSSMSSKSTSRAITKLHKARLVERRKQLGIPLKTLNTTTTATAAAATTSTTTATTTATTSATITAASNDLHIGSTYKPHQELSYRECQVHVGCQTSLTMRMLESIHISDDENSNVEMRKTETISHQVPVLKLPPQVTRQTIPTSHNENETECNLKEEHLVGTCQPRLKPNPNPPDSLLNIDTDTDEDDTIDGDIDMEDNYISDSDSEEETYQEAVEDSSSSYQPSSEDNSDSSPFRPLSGRPLAEDRWLYKDSKPTKCTRDPIENDANRKYIVYEKHLLSLLNICQNCRGDAVPIIIEIKSTMVTVIQKCKNLKCKGYLWKSQPELKKGMPAGGLALSSAVLFSGSTLSKILKVLRFMGVQALHPSTYYKHQRHYLHPAVKLYGDSRIRQCMEETAGSCVLAGDGRFSSVGKTAKYGLYTFLDLERSVIITKHVVQKNEVPNSYWMEIEGFKRCRRDLIQSPNPPNDVTLVTDRHPQITKWIRENWGNIHHYFDCWHIAKGIKKKLLVLCQKFPDIREWHKAIITHLYWCATSSGGDGASCLAKWKSLMHHIANNHTDFPYDEFKHCEHDLENINPRLWLRPGSQQYEDLADIVEAKSLLRSVPKMSPLGQTASIEGFHSLVNHFAPKMKHFSYLGMCSRLTIAVLHHNENSHRAIATNQLGMQQWNLTYPRAKKGEPTVRTIKVPPTYNYVDGLYDELFRLVCTPQGQADVRRVREELKNSVPETPSKSYPQANKAQCIQEKYNRFAMNAQNPH